MNDYKTHVDYFLQSIKKIEHIELYKHKINLSLYSIFELYHFFEYEPKEDIYYGVIKYLELVNKKPLVGNKYLFYRVSTYNYIHQQIFIGIIILFSLFGATIYCVEELDIFNSFTHELVNKDNIHCIEYSEQWPNRIDRNINLLLLKYNTISPLFSDVFVLLDNNDISTDSIKNITFTFDDGPHPIYTNQLLDILKERNIKAMFFVLGKNICKYKDIAGRIHSDGHELGNHGWDHTSFRCLTKKQIITQLQKTSLFIKNITKKNPTYFRPPYGHTNSEINDYVFKELQLVVNMGNVSSQDSFVKDSTRIAKNIIEKIDEGAIIIGHDTSLESITAFSEIFNSIDKNYNCLVLSDLLNL